MNKTHKGKADMPHPTPPKWKVTMDDESTGSVMDTARPRTGQYEDTRNIGPVSKTKFGQNRNGD